MRNAGLHNDEKKIKPARMEKGITARRSRSILLKSIVCTSREFTQMKTIMQNIIRKWNAFKEHKELSYV
jgi:hypothetical protein